MQLSFSFGRQITGNLNMLRTRGRWNVSAIVVLGVAAPLACTQREPTEPRGSKQPTASEKPGEEPFVSADGGFRVRFPVPPVQKKQAVPASESTMYTADVGRVSYGVSWMPVQLGPGEGSEAYLDGIVETFSGQPFILRTLTRAEVTLDGQPGRELGVQAQGGEMRLRWYIGKGRLYQVGVMGPAGAGDTEAAKQFFASFAFHP